MAHDHQDRRVSRRRLITGIGSLGLGGLLTAGDPPRRRHSGRRPGLRVRLRHARQGSGAALQCADVQADAQHQAGPVLLRDRLRPQ
ncbi:hypothetical protein [Nonomuraea salmonea]|uniref:hypothetical protein n=1 Tax=Nonomuraea salmonea TaxID=46181 RepID=UPI0031E91492